MPRVPKTKYESVVKTPVQMRKMFKKQQEDLRKRQQRQLKAVTRARKAEKIYHKTGKWPRWFK